MTKKIKEALPFIFVVAFIAFVVFFNSLFATIMAIFISSFFGLCCIALTINFIRMKTSGFVINVGRNIPLYQAAFEKLKSQINTGSIGFEVRDEDLKLISQKIDNLFKDEEINRLIVKDYLIEILYRYVNEIEFIRDVNEKNWIKRVLEYTNIYTKKYWLKKF